MTPMPPKSPRTPVTTARARLRQWTQEGLMPFRAARALSRAEVRRVAAIWAVAGAVFAALWAGALMLVLPGFSGLGALGAVAAISVGGGLFFGLVARLVVGVFNRAFASDGEQAAEPASEQARLARDGQPLPLDPK